MHGFVVVYILLISYTTLHAFHTPHAKLHPKIVGSIRAVQQIGNWNVHNKYCGVRKVDTKLQLDIFGLGPAEVVIIFGVVLLLFGPDRVKEQLREKGVKSKIVSKGWKAEREERIKDMTEFASARRTKRALKRINDAIESGDEKVLEKFMEFEELNS